MFKLVKSEEVCSEFIKSLYNFLRKYDLIDSEQNLYISKSELNSVAKVAANQIIDNYDDCIIVNNLKWHHYQNDKIPWFGIIEILKSQLKLRKNYINKRYVVIPEVIFDLNQDNIDGELRESLCMLRSTKQKLLV